MGWIPGWESIAGTSWWSAFWFWASIVSLIGLGVAEVASHRYQTRKDTLVAIEEATKDKRHEDEMARLQHDTAKANERAAQLEMEAAQAQLETERIKELVGWRVVSEPQGEAMVATLKAHPAVITLGYVAGDPEALFLTTIFGKILTDAGWKYSTSAETFFGSLVWDLHVPAPDTEAIQLLRTALQAAKIPYVTDPIPPADMVRFSGAEKTEGIFFVGSKRPPGR